jgi:tetratricopeptide (TPR) repeat protein
VSPRWVLLALTTIACGCSPRAESTQPQIPSSESVDAALECNNRGRAWHDKGEFDKAIRDYDEAIRCVPTFAIANNNRGMAWQKKGELDKAITDYNEALRIDPKLARVFQSRDRMAREARR